MEERRCKVTDDGWEHRAADSSRVAGERRRGAYDLPIWSMHDDSRVATFINEALAAEEREFYQPVGSGDDAPTDERDAARCRTFRMVALLNYRLRTRSPFLT